MIPNSIFPLCLIPESHEINEREEKVVIRQDIQSARERKNEGIQEVGKEGNGNKSIETLLDLKRMIE